MVLVLFAGPRRDGDATDAAAELGIPLLAVDLALGGAFHDVLQERVRDDLRHICNEGTVVAAHFAPPCRSYSPLNAHLCLRSKTDPEGEDAPLSHRAYISRENTLSRFTCELAGILVARGAPVTIENSPDLSEEGKPWHWGAMGHLASLWDTSAGSRGQHGEGHRLHVLLRLVLP